MCHKLKKEEGLYLGGSSGLNISAAIKLASQLPADSHSTIVTIGCDSGEKYESKIFNKKWLSQNKFDQNISMK